MVYLLAAFKCVRLTVGTQESLIKFLRRTQMFDDKYLKMMRHLKIVPFLHHHHRLAVLQFFSDNLQCFVHEHDTTTSD